MDVLKEFSGWPLDNAATSPLPATTNSVRCTYFNTICNVNAGIINNAKFVGLLKGSVQHFIYLNIKTNPYTFEQSDDLVPLRLVVLLPIMYLERF